MTTRPIPARFAAEPRAIEVECDGAVHIVRLRRHRRARRYTLRVTAAKREAVLTMPLRGSLREAEDFARRHGGWIASRLGRLPGVVRFAPGTEIPLRGVAHVIAHRPGVRGTVWTETGPDGRHLLCVAGSTEHVARRVADYLKREAKRDLDQAVARYAGQIAVTARRISIRDQASRWGSCSSTGALSFSWRLILAPDYVLDYLAAHEVAHLKEMNHSVRFWRLLAGMCPDLRRAKSWLDANGAGLYRYGVAARAEA